MKDRTKVRDRTMVRDRIKVRDRTIDSVWDWKLVRYRSWGREPARYGSWQGQMVQHFGKLAESTKVICKPYDPVIPFLVIYLP